MSQVIIWQVSGDNIACVRCQVINIAGAILSYKKIQENNIDTGDQDEYRKTILC